MFRPLKILLVLGTLATLATVQPTASAATTGQTRNLFHELLGKSEAELNAKLDAAWAHFFQGDAANQRLYYPVGSDLAYIAEIGRAHV